MPIETLRYLRAIRRHLVFLLSLVALAVIASTIAFAGSDHPNTSTIDMVVRSTSPLDDPSRVLRTQSRVLASESVLGPVADTKRFGSMDDIRKHVTFRPFADSDVIRVTASAQSQSDADGLAQAVVQSYTKFSADKPAADAAEGQTTGLGLAPVIVIGGQHNHSFSNALRLIRNDVAFGILAAVLGLIIVWGRFALDRTVRDEERFAEVFPFRVVGRVSNKAFKTSGDLTTLNNSAFGEIDWLAAATGRNDGGAARISITSVGDLDVRPSISALLASESARSGVKTLLVDADSDKKKLSQVIAVDRRTPSFALLTQKLAESSEWTPESEHIGELESLTNMYFVPAGASINGARRLSQALARKLVLSLSTIYDKVVVDCPNLASADAPSVATASDLLLVIVKLGSTNEAELRDAAQALEAANVNVGAVLVTDQRN